MDGGHAGAIGGVKAVEMLRSLCRGRGFLSLQVGPSGVAGHWTPELSFYHMATHLRHNSSPNDSSVPPLSALQAGYVLAWMKNYDLLHILFAAYPGPASVREHYLV